MTARTTIKDDDDLLWGAEAIGKVIKRKPGRTYYLLEGGHLNGAAKKIGGVWVARRSKLRAWPFGDEQGA